MNHRADDFNYVEFCATPEEINKCLNCTRKVCKGSCAELRDSPIQHLRPWVRCIETGEVFKTAEAAAAKIGRSSRSVRDNLKGVSKHCAGLHFEYVRSGTDA